MFINNVECMSKPFLKRWNEMPIWHLQTRYIRRHRILKNVLSVIIYIITYKIQHNCVQINLKGSESAGQFELEQSAGVIRCFWLAANQLSVSSAVPSNLIRNCPYINTKYAAVSNQTASIREQMKEMDTHSREKDKPPSSDIFWKSTETHSTLRNRSKGLNYTVNNLRFY